MGSKGTDIGVGAALGGPLGAGVGYLASQGGSGGQQVFPGLPPFLQPLWNKAQSQIPDVAPTLDPATYTMTPLQKMIQGSASSALSPTGMVPGLQNLISSILSPNFANPMTNPNMQSVLKGSQDMFTQSLGKNLDMLGSTFGLSGQVPGQSGSFSNSANQLSRQALSDYNNNISNILFGQYNTGINQQMQAANASPMVSNILNSYGSIAGLPQQLASTAQQGQLDMNQIPFNMILGLLGQTPITYPSFAPPDNTLSQIASILGGLGEFGKGAGAVLAA